MLVSLVLAMACSHKAASLNQTILSQPKVLYDKSVTNKYSPTQSLQADLNLSDKNAPRCPRNKPAGP